MMKRGMLKALACVLPLCAPTLCGAQPAPALDKAGVETIVHDYILAHPDIIPEAIQVLQDRKQSETINQNRSRIETPWGYEWEGDAHGDVTVVEFFDYNCGYCRASVADVQRLLVEDKHLKIVYREIPVLGEESDHAALVSLSLAETAQNWTVFHRRVYARNGAGDAALAQAGQEAGLKMPTALALKASALRVEINANLTLAQKLGVSGTPSWVVGNKILSGAVGYDALKEAIAEARKAHQTLK